MKHSILIPHRNRDRQLELCLWSIHRSAIECGVKEYEVVAADSGQNGVCVDGWASGWYRVIPDPVPPAVFNKPRCLNLAIDAARGEILTFLDADAIVGKRFMETVDAFDREPSLVRVNYRVRYLAEDDALGIEMAADKAAHVDSLFAHYDSFPHGWEAYGHHHLNTWTDSVQPWGNSQFSICRKDLRGCRPDEAYAGRGQEDMDFNCQLEAAWGEAYRGVIFTDADHAMFHQRHEYEPEWNDEGRKRLNNERYRAKRMKLLGF